MKANGRSTARHNLLWLQSGGCGGCTLSLLNAESPNLVAALSAGGIHLLWHPSLSEASGAEASAVLEGVRTGETLLDILCLEGSVIRGPNGTGKFHMLSGTGRPVMDWLAEIASRADYVAAVGSCAAFGGITSAGGNPAEACGLAYEGTRAGGLLGAGFRSRAGLPVINIAGCPTHPNWVIETLLQICAGDFSANDMDQWGRPRSYADHLVHHGCARNEYYEYKASAREFSELGCLMEHLGCKGTQAHADCNTRLWNGDGSCLRGGYPCINCTAPGFEEPRHAFVETPKVAGIPVGLPTDMPKAWFVALAALSKAATPRRLRDNAVADYIRVPPSDKTGAGK